MTERLSKSDSLILQGFGTFHPWSQTAREGRNPRTGETCLIRPRRSVKFKPGKMLLQKLNNTDEQIKTDLSLSYEGKAGFFIVNISPPPPKFSILISNFTDSKIIICQ